MASGTTIISSKIIPGTTFDHFMLCYRCGTGPHSTLGSSLGHNRLMNTERIQRYGTHGSLGAINMIVVIESLREDDWKTGRLIREDLEVVALPYAQNLEVHYKTARDAAEFEFLLQELEAYVRVSGRAPCLHIQCHGDADGLQLTDGSRMLWDRLKPLLVNINLASRMNLFLVLACCYGGYFAAECRYHEPVPFAYILGPGKAIAADPLFALNTAFYGELLKTRNVTQALTVAGGVRPDIAYFSMSAVGIFRVALTGRIEREESAEARARIKAIEEPVFDNYRRRFFALDQFPENADRFAITYRDVFDEVHNRKRG
jgi:hypothetical protein